MMDEILTSNSSGTGEFSPQIQERVMELSSLQRGYFVGGRPDLDLHVYPHLYLEYKLTNCNVDRLRRAVNQLVQRHDILRASVLSSAKLMIASQAEEVDVIFNDLSLQGTEKQHDLIEGLRQQLIRFQFDNKKAPAIDVHVSKLSQCFRVHISLNLLLIDASSVRLILDDLSQLYEHGESTLKLSPLDVEAIKSLRKREQNSDRYQRLKDYWIERLNDFPDAPVLPIKQGENLLRRSRLNRHRHLINRDKWLAFRSRCESIEVPPSSVLLALYGLSVNYWCKYPQFYITVMVQGSERDRLPQANFAANFAKTLLMTFDFSQQQPLGSHIAQVHKQLFRDMTKSAVCGLEILQEKNRQDRTTTRAASPIAFVSMLTDPDNPIADGLFQIESNRMIYNSLETPQVLLDHQAVSRPDGGVTLALDAMDSAFEAQTAEDIFNAYTGLVESFASMELDLEEASLDLRSQKQREAHIQYNDCAHSYSSLMLHEYLYSAVDKHPESTLVIDSEGSHSYSDVYRRSNQLAHVLREQFNVQPNDLIAVNLTKSWQQVVVLQAILAAGGAYVPIMPSWPTIRKKTVVQRCQCRLVIAEPEVSDISNIDGVEALFINDARIDTASEKQLESQQLAGDIAYILFTSGSTGIPKGVVLNHSGPANTIEDINRRFDIHQNDRILALSDLSFDLSVYDIFGSIAAGATIVFPEEGRQQDPGTNYQLLQEHEITVWNSVPALIQLMTDYLNLSDVKTQLNLKTIMMSGDWIPTSLPAKIYEYAPKANVVSLGGATEASIWSIYYPISKGEKFHVSVPYGYPLANQSIYLLDNNLDPRPDDVPGDIYIAGTGLAVGYWNDSEKTNLAFIQDPKTGQRLYRTGDWGVRRPGGHIEFLGREDGQVKIRGFRIELGEIESVLQRHSNIDTAVVKTAGRSPQTKQIIGYVSLSDPESNRLTESDLKTYLDEYLPSYMIPSRIRFIDKMPLTPTGKIDRKSLVIEDETLTIKDETIKTSPKTKTEKELAKLWTTLLKVKNVSQQDDFFDLGGTSFSAVRMMVSITSNFGVEITLPALIQRSRLEDLATYIERIQQSGAEEHFLPQAINNSLSSIYQFWLHPSGGNVLCYRDIAQRLEEEFRCYGITADMASRDRGQFISVEKMARRYLDQIRHIQPNGPYHLAGWSYGGVLAYEISQQLLALGENVESLVMIDTPIIESSIALKDRQLVKWFISDLCEVDDASLFDDINSSDPEVSALLEKSAQLARSKNFLPDFSDIALDSLFSVFKRNLIALNEYRPTPLKYVKKVLLICADENKEERVASNAGSTWQNLVSDESRCVTLKGNHYSLLKTPSTDQISRLIISNTKRPDMPQFLTEI